MDECGLSRQFSFLFWEHLEDAFNNRISEYFMNFKRHPNDEDIEWRWVFTMDDDKVREEYSNARYVPFGEKSHLKRVRNVYFVSSNMFNTLRRWTRSTTP